VIPLIEYFDQIKVTLRLGDKRTCGAHHRNRTKGERNRSRGESPGALARDVDKRSRRRYKMKNSCERALRKDREMVKAKKITRGS